MENIYEEDYDNYVDFLDDEDCMGMTKEQLKMVARRKRIEERVAQLLLDKILEKYNSNAISYVDQAIYDFTRKNAEDYFWEMHIVFEREIERHIQNAAKEYIDREITKRLRKIVE